MLSDSIYPNSSNSMNQSRTAQNVQLLFFLQLPWQIYGNLYKNPILTIQATLGGKIFF